MLAFQLKICPKPLPIVSPKLEKSLEILNNEESETALIEILKIYREDFACCVPGCTNSMKKQKGQAGRSLLTLNLSCNEHKSGLICFIQQLPPKVFSAVAAKFGIEEFMNIISQNKYNPIDQIAQAKTHLQLLSVNQAIATRNGRQTAITEFTKNPEVPKAVESSTVISDAQHLAENLDPANPYTIVIKALFCAFEEKIKLFVEEISSLKNELKTSKNEDSKSQETPTQAPYLAATRTGVSRVSVRKETKTGVNVRVTQTEKPLRTAPTAEEIRMLLRKSNPGNIDPLKTIHIEGFSKCRVSLIKRVFSDAGINVAKIKDISFIRTKLMEVIIFSSYENTIFEKLGELEQRPEYKGLVIKKVWFDPFSKENI